MLDVPRGVLGADRAADEVRAVRGLGVDVAVAEARLAAAIGGVLAHVEVAGPGVAEPRGLGLDRGGVVTDVRRDAVAQPATRLHPGVAVPTRARGRRARPDAGVVDVAVAGDAVQAVAGDRVGALGREEVRAEPPADELHRGVLHRRGRAHLVEVAHHGDAHVVGVHAVVAGVGAPDLEQRAAAAALEDLAVLVDQEVVADVAPATALHVVRLRRADDRLRVAARVAVAAGGVVEDHAPRLRAVARGVAAAVGAGAPLASG